MFTKRTILDVWQDSKRTTLDVWQGSKYTSCLYIKCGCSYLVVVMGRCFIKMMPWKILIHALETLFNEVADLQHTCDKSIHA